MTSTLVTDPQGRTWTVRRKWVHRRLRWRGRGLPTSDLLGGADIVGAGAGLPIIGTVLLAIACLLIAIAAVLFIVPAVVFLAELLFVIAVVALGLLGRTLFGRPWTVEAREGAADQAYEWKVTGWGASRDLVRSVADQLQATGLPTGGDAVPPAVT